VRRAFKPFVHHYVALSGQINAYLTGPIGVPSDHVSRLCNGVDMSRFLERAIARDSVGGIPFDRSAWVVGTVGRLQAVKDQGLLLQALAIARRDGGDDARRLRLAIVGDGPLRGELEALARRLDLQDATWFAGERSDVPALLRAMDLFVLPSLAEGISNTVLEAMAAGLPVIATDVGGNAELIEQGVTGHLIPRRDAHALAETLLTSVRRPDEARAAGRAGQLRVAQRFSIDAMVRGYDAMYTTLLARRGIAAAATMPQT
jgi:sugar transferase (PEP-CTERM/EpsH1 system associated)